MLIIGLCPANLERAVWRFNREHAATIEMVDVQDKSSTRRTATRCRFVPSHSTDKYGRLSHSGRRVKALCWHGHRDLFRDLFEAYDPDDTGEIEIRTSFANYRSKSDFEREYPLTDRNIGSQVQPMRYSEACEC